MNNAAKMVVVGNAQQQEHAKELQAIQARMKELQQGAKPLTVQVKEFTSKEGELKRGIEIKGNGRPLFLYGSQAERLFGESDEAKAFRAATLKLIEDNRSELTWQK